VSDLIHEEGIMSQTNMETTTEPDMNRSVAGLENFAKVFAGTSFTEAAIAGGAVVLTILGIVGVFRESMLTIATIVIGASLLVEGLGLVSRLSQLRELAARRSESLMIANGMSVEATAGIAGIALGILALLGVVPMVLTSVAVIVYGGALVFGGGTEMEIENVLSRFDQSEVGGKVLRSSVFATSGSNLLAGIGAATLGIVALSGVQPMVLLALIGELAVAASLALSGTALGAQLGIAAARH
jgi:hypothetical protein